MPFHGGMDVNRVHEVLRRHVTATSFPFVLDLERSHGSWLFDAKTGTALLDFYTFYASLPLGFNHPALMAAEASSELLRAARTKVANCDASTPEYAAFVETLERTAAPASMSHYFFVEGGALAVENALKAAFDWKVRRNLAAGRGELGSQILHFTRAFHGRSGYTLSLTNTEPAKTQYFPKFDWPRIPGPALSFPLTEATLAEASEAERVAIEGIERAFAERPHELAAIIIEPVQSEGGDRHFRVEFLRELRRLANEHDALLIFDEVQTGMGMTGRWWAFEHFGVEPDLLCCAKKLQLGTLFAGPRLDEVPGNVFQQPGRISSTWAGGLCDMVRATHVLETIEREGTLANAAARGEELRVGLVALSERYPALVSNARGLGLLCALDLPGRAERDEAIKRCYAEERMLVLPCGERSLRFRPALNVPADVVAEGLARLDRVLGRLATSTS